MTSQPSAPDRPSRRRVIAAAAFALAGCAPTRPAERDDMSQPDPDGETIIVDGVKIHFVRQGRGPAVALIHGASGNLRDWTFRAAPALAEDYTTIAFDRPGHGLSGSPADGDASLRVQAALMRGALARMGIGRAYLAGHSYGGSVALAWALDAPETVAGLMLLAAPSQVWEGGLGLTTELLATPVIGGLLAGAAPVVVSRGIAERALDAIFAPQQAPEGYLDHIRLDLVLRPATLRANARQLAALKAQLGAMAPRYLGLAMPVELLHGTADETVPLRIHSEPLVRQLPRARLTRLEGIGHMPHHVALPQAQTALGRLARG